ncbi:alpha/beta hydrolase [Nonomuraea sp. NPDC049695]|uniref:alpha/beta fold hydrolase n=1 Tax=Nonomuraea sp. NPDC049695 TaxID=3154734 RepID=UPI0034209A78
MSRHITTPLGRRYEVEGKQLFLHRSGTGGPAVVILPGAAAMGLDYLNLHERVSRFTTGVIFDRAGTGWSDPTTLPRSAAEAADELLGLLRAADVPGPYVLVGHSLGGLHARRFAQRHPDQVAGLVALDVFYEKWDEYVPEPFRLTQAQAMNETVTEIPAELVEAARGLLDGMFAQWPQEIREALVERHLDPEEFAAGMRERANLADLADEVRRAGEVPAVPVIAFAAMGIDPGQLLYLPEELLREQNEAKRAMYADMTGGEVRVLENASHSWIHIEAEDAVVEGIEEMVAKVRG